MSEHPLVKSFGPWRSACEDIVEAPAPVGEPCTRCKEPIQIGQEGLLIPCIGGDAVYVPYHRGCFLRALGVE